MEYIPEKKKDTNATISKLLPLKERSISISSVLPHHMSYKFLHMVDG